MIATSSGRAAVLAALVGFTLFAGAAAQAATIVAPSAATNKEGDYMLNIIPQRGQEVISSSNFPSMPILITQFAFRPDSSVTAPFSTTLASVEFDLSTTQAQVDALSATFDNNLGPDNTVVFNGPLTLSSNNTTLANGTKAFDVVVPLQHNFLYNPANGNLLIQTLDPNSTPTPQSIPALDDRADTGDTTSSAYVYPPNGDTFTHGTTDTSGLVVQLTYTPQAVVPEPGEAAMLGAGILLLLGAGWRCRRRH